MCACLFRQLLVPSLIIVLSVCLSPLLSPPLDVLFFVPCGRRMGGSAMATSSISGGSGGSAKRRGRVTGRTASARNLGRMSMASAASDLLPVAEEGLFQVRALSGNVGVRMLLCFYLRRHFVCPLVVLFTLCWVFFPPQSESVRTAPPPPVTILHQ